MLKQEAKDLVVMPERGQKKVLFKTQTMDADNETEQEKNEHEISDDALIKAREYHRKQKKAIDAITEIDIVNNLLSDAEIQLIKRRLRSKEMNADNETKQTEKPQADKGADFMKKLMAAMEASKNQPSKHTVCVDVYAPTKEQAHAAVGMMLRTDATMFTLDAVPYTACCRVDWESLRLQGVPQPDGNAMLWPLLAMMMAMPSK